MRASSRLSSAPSTFTVGDDATASGGHHILSPAGMLSEDQPGTATARYDLGIGIAGDYVIWARFPTPDWQHNRIWAEVDGGPWTSGAARRRHLVPVLVHPTYHTPVVYQGLCRVTTKSWQTAPTASKSIASYMFPGVADSPRRQHLSGAAAGRDSHGGQCVPSCGALVEIAATPPRAWASDPASPTTAQFAATSAIDLAVR